MAGDVVCLEGTDPKKAPRAPRMGGVRRALKYQTGLERLKARRVAITIAGSIVG